ncbi:MAG: glycosyltransferase family 2 protein [Lachnospirales bacterium]
MKLISVVVPCFNSEKYLNKCINTLLHDDDSVEIIIVNDGSTDKTDIIAKKYLEKYPNKIKYVVKENGGHGDAVCAGLKVATGKYFKVCDSDDWFDRKAYDNILETLHKCHNENMDIDMFINNFVYEKASKKKKRIMNYRSTVPTNTILKWEDIKLRHYQFFLMHSVIYKRDILLKANLQLPKHTFYVDNLYVFVPLKYVKTIYYIDENLYRYFIGRDDQSVNEANMIKKVDQQIFVNKEMFDVYRAMKDCTPKLKKYAKSYLQVITTVSSILLVLDGSKEALKKKKELWKYFKTTDPKVYRSLRYSIQGKIVNMPNSLNTLKKLVYKIYRKVWGFN